MLSSSSSSVTSSKSAIRIFQHVGSRAVRSTTTSVSAIAPGVNSPFRNNAPSNISGSASVASLLGRFQNLNITKNATTTIPTTITNGSTNTTRTFVTTSSPVLMSLDEFRDPVSRQIRATQPVGRPWSVNELRIKSFDDLHKLWIVLYKERNMLLTEQQLSRRRGLTFPQPERIRKVRKSMGAIKQVLGERKRDHLAQLAYKQLQKESEFLNSITEEDTDNTYDVVTYEDDHDGKDNEKDDDDDDDNDSNNKNSSEQENKADKN